MHFVHMDVDKAPLVPDIVFVHKDLISRLLQPRIFKSRKAIFIRMLIRTMSIP